MKKWTAAMLALSLLLFSASFAEPVLEVTDVTLEEDGSFLSDPALPEDPETADASAESPDPKVLPLVSEMITAYAVDGKTSEAAVGEYLSRIRETSPSAASKWEEIMHLWKELPGAADVRRSVLPDGLPDTDELCIVVLGYQLKADGSMRQELLDRLTVALESAKKYPNAVLVCTGGPTAANNREATEGGRMRDWLIAKGVPEDKVFAETESLTTAENAVYTLDLLKEKAPQVTDLAIVSSDYHVPTGMLLFEARSILGSGDSGRIHVVSGAGCKGSSSISTVYQAFSLAETAGY